MPSRLVFATRTIRVSRPRGLGSGAPDPQLRAKSICSFFYFLRRSIYFRPSAALTRAVKAMSLSPCRAASREHDPCDAEIAASRRKQRIEQSLSNTMPSSHLIPDVPAERKGLEGAGVAPSGGVHVTHVDLDGRVVLGGDEPLGPGAAKQQIWSCR